MLDLIRLSVKHSSYQMQRLAIEGLQHEGREFSQQFNTLFAPEFELKLFYFPSKRLRFDLLYQYSFTGV